MAQDADSANVVRTFVEHCRHLTTAEELAGLGGKPL